MLAKDLVRAPSFPSVPFHLRSTGVEMDYTEAAHVVACQLRRLVCERRGLTEPYKALHGRLEPGAPLHQQIEALPHDRNEGQPVLVGDPQQSERRIGLTFQYG